MYERRAAPTTPDEKGRRFQDDHDLRAQHERVMLAIGAELHRLMERQGISVRALARLAGVDVSTVKKLLKGSKGNRDADPCLSTIVRVFYPLGRLAVVSVIEIATGALVTPGYTAKAA